MSRYFLYGYYGFGNFGDDLLLQALVSNITARDPEAEFVVRARAPVVGFDGDSRVRFLQAEEILEDGNRNKFSRFMAYRAALVEAVRQCDVTVVGGGTLFIDKGRMNWSLLFIHEVLRAARTAGRKTVVAGVAIDILAHPASVWLTQRIFAMADFSAVRDALSLAYFQDCDRPPVLAADLAWLQQMPKLAHELEAQKKRQSIGLNLIDYYRSSTQSARKHEAYRAAVRRLIERHRDECDFHLVALQKGIGQRDDWFADEFRELVPEGKIFYVDSVASLASLLGQVSAIITTRFHLALLAARMNVSTCILDHELKLTSLAQDLMLPTLPLSEFVSDVSTPDPIESLASWDSVATQRAVERQVARAARNFSWLASE